MAAHLRAAFPGDGEEVAEVIARHYLDALDALPTDPDASEIRSQAIAALVRAAERAARTSAPGLAAASYAAAAQLTQTGTAVRPQAAAAGLWEHAASAATTNADWATAVEQAGHAAELYQQGGDARSAARAETIAGEALRVWVRHAATAGGPDPGTGFAAAITGLRQHSTLYHLAHGLLDHAEHLFRLGDDEAAGAAIGEARGIAQRLGCQPLRDRAETIQPASPRAAAS